MSESTTEIPHITTYDERDKLHEEKYGEGVPFVWINQIRGRTWCYVIASLEPTASPSRAEDTDILTEEAVEQVNQICDTYIDAVRETGKRLSTGAPCTNYGATFMMFPDMRPEDAEPFAEELADVILDETNRENKLDNFLN
ncbi:hypothetical protein [Halocatena marina]|uniref:hypothetical protein n=1 Tax=Halocatena marina TaxID=2934937 RepID=UPI00200F91A7|nr:hypothetical protein [Halocatena marina]